MYNESMESYIAPSLQNNVSPLDGIEPSTEIYESAPKIDATHSLIELHHGFRSIFPKSSTVGITVTDARMQEVNHGYQLNIEATVINMQQRSKYQSAIAIYRDSKKTGWSPALRAKVHCTCDAFRYYNAYPNWTGNALRGIADKMNKVQYVNPLKGRQRNPAEIKGVCKHLAVLIEIAAQQKVFNSR
jgi:hypothetical protein